MSACWVWEGVGRVLGGVEAVCGSIRGVGETGWLRGKLALKYNSPVMYLQKKWCS